MDKIVVIRVCDAMKAGGQERMVVNIANALASACGVTARWTSGH